MNNYVKLIEEISFNAHPALNTVFYDGWYLRFAEGYTKRSNSVNMLQASSLPYEEKIKFCERMYESQNLPTIFKITPLSLQVDLLLEKMGYCVVTNTDIMVMDIPEYNIGKNKSIVLHGIHKEWQEGETQLFGSSESVSIISRKIQNKILDQALCASITIDNKVVANGLCVVENNYAGIYDIAVASEYRRKGYAQDIITSLLANASKLGAKKTYIQVVANNNNAIQLYTKLGYVDKYQYWYRVKNN